MVAQSKGAALGGGALGGEAGQWGVRPLGSGLKIGRNGKGLEAVHQLQDWMTLRQQGVKAAGDKERRRQEGQAGRAGNSRCSRELAREQREAQVFPSAEHEGSGAGTPGLPRLSP